MIDPDWIVRRVLLGFVLAVLALIWTAGRPAVTATDLLPRLSAIGASSRSR